MQNIEIKAYATDYDEQFEKGLSISTQPREILRQKDTFFKCPQGRLKLREIPGQKAELIFYQRADQAGPKVSVYHITRTQDSDQLLQTMSNVCGLVGVVTKVRTLLMCGRTRLHFDQVDGLGSFIELEVVMMPDDDLTLAQQEAQDLMQKLGIKSEDLIDCAYMDLMRK